MPISSPPATPLKIMCCVGTRPEVIKMAPIIRRLKAAAWANCVVVTTAQHRDLLDQTLAFFDLRPDVDLNLMTPAQTLAELSAQMLTSLDRVLGDVQPDLVLAQGDTTTVLMTALAAFYRRIPFGHVEAGLRSGSLREPFPEEGNRTLAGRLAQWHFAPTEAARNNLLKEGFSAADIFVVGNTVIDALLESQGRAVLPWAGLRPDQRMILVTAHRRESFGEPMREICRAVKAICEKHPDVVVLWPVHPNPAAHDLIYQELSAVPAVRLTAPLDYGHLVGALRQACLVMTDSGGIQEEAPAFHKPVLVLRDRTERQEVIDAGVARLVRVNAVNIARECGNLLSDPALYARMAQGANPYGQGDAAEKIVRHIENFSSNRAFPSRPDAGTSSGTQM